MSRGFSGYNYDLAIMDDLTMSTYDKQVGGGHYTKMKIQPFQYSMANGLDPMQHTVIKYVTRFRDKNGVEDLKKAIHTIELLIEHEEGQKPKVGRVVPKSEPTKQAPTVTCWGLPFPVGTPLDIIYDLQDISDTPYGGRSLPKGRYDSAKALSKKQATLVRCMLSGEVPVNIVARTYEEAQALARSYKWPTWTYYPASSNLSGINARVFVIAPKAKVTSTTLFDLYIRRNIVIQLD